MSNFETSTKKQHLKKSSFVTESPQIDSEISRKTDKMTLSSIQFSTPEKKNTDTFRFVSESSFSSKEISVFISSTRSSLTEISVPTTCKIRSSPWSECSKECRDPRDPELITKKRNITVFTKIKKK